MASFDEDLDRAETCKGLVLLLNGFKERKIICDLTGASLHFCSQILPKKLLKCCREKSGYARFYFSENRTLIIQRYLPFSLKKLAVSVKIRCQSKKNINWSKCVFHICNSFRSISEVYFYWVKILPVPLGVNCFLDLCIADVPILYLD